VGSFDLAGTLRRIRRAADLSQRQLADAIGSSAAAIGAAEAGSRDLPAGLLARAAETAGLRLALLDAQGQEVAGMADDAVRDLGYRRYPAHLDPRRGDEGWWYPDSRRARPTPWYTFDRARWRRDAWREHHGTPADHLLPSPDDDPADREALRREERRADARRRHEEERAAWLRRVAAGEVTWWPDPECSCPAGCDATAESWRDVHVEDCPCRCDVS
jgi:transcriptional regulator with XRE-family HTH domain